MLPHTLISTVGTSLLGNLSRADDPEMKRFLEQENWAQVARLLREKPANDRLCGAEINSIYEIERRNLISAKPYLHFCVSDTPDGGKMQSLLESYYSQDRQAKTHLIEGLEPDVNRFRRVGLRNLVRKIAEIIRQAGGAQGVAINATGGYKAQIALAAIIGQTLDVAVYYKHESFAEVIALPPMPVGFNFDIFGTEADLLLALEEQDLIPIERDISEEVAPLIEEIEEGGTRYASLSAMGQLFLEGYRLRYPPEKHLPMPVPPQEKKDPTFRDDNYPKGFKEYVKKVWQETSYIKTCHSTDYNGQKGIKDRAFRIDRHNGEIVGEYRDSSFGGRFVIFTSAQTQAQKLAVISDLSMRYKE